MPFEGLAQSIHGILAAALVLVYWGLNGLRQGKFAERAVAALLGVLGTGFVTTVLILFMPISTFARIVGFGGMFTVVAFNTVVEAGLAAWIIPHAPGAPSEHGVPYSRMVLRYSMLALVIQAVGFAERALWRPGSEIYTYLLVWLVIFSGFAVWFWWIERKRK